MAPEVIKRKYNEKCDIWSCGVIMYILLTGRPPFDGEDDNEILENVKIGKYDMTNHPFPLLSDESKDLITKLLEYNPNKRISASEALNHSWFKTAEFKKKDQINIVPHSLAKQMISNLTKYNSDNMLRCTVIAYLVHHNTNIEQCVEAGKLFNKIDLNNNGRIEKEELIKGIEKYWKLNRSEVEKQVDCLFNNIDTDHNGFIEYEEFVRAAVDPKIFMSRNYLKFAFGYFDRDNSGDISLEEIKKRFMQNSKNNSEKVETILKKMTDAEREIILKQEDNDYLTPLLNAIHVRKKSKKINSNDEINIINLLWEYHVDINQENSKGLTPLLLAIENNDLIMVEYLLKRNAEINRPNKNNILPFNKALEKSNIKILNILLEFKAEIPVENKYLKQEIIHHIKRGNLLFVDYIILNKDSDISKIKKSLTILKMRKIFSNN